MLVYVIIFLNTKELEIDKYEEMSQILYHYDFNDNTVSYVETDFYGGYKSDFEQEPIEEGTQAYFIMEWAQNNK
jgi:hypothetical protein